MSTKYSSWQNRQLRKDWTTGWPKAIARRESVDEWFTRGDIMDLSIHDLVAATLVELGLPAPTNFIQTMLMRDRYFAGWKFRYDGGFAVLNENTLELCDEQGTVLKTVGLEDGKGAAA
jgi:hypothetical protein